MSDQIDQKLSPFSGFSKLDAATRLEKLKAFAHLSQDEVDTLTAGQKSLDLEKAEGLIENVIGLFTLPLGLATNFKIDGKDIAIPMAIEETSVVAAASSAAKWVYRNGGFKTSIRGNLIIGQIQFPTVQDAKLFEQKVAEHKNFLIEKANETIPGLLARGGGVVAIQVRRLERPDGQQMAVLHVLCNPCDAMGANLINQVCETLKPHLEKITGEKIGLCILSNLVDTKLVEAMCEIKDADPKLAMAIAEATLFANLDPYRGATHNKGVMNAIDSILIATGNDWRAVEAGVHAYAAQSGYHSVTEWTYSKGILRGRIVIPMAVGTVGGVTKIHPTAKVCLKILGVEKSDSLSRICAAAGLAQNLAALRALCGEGIVQGHMRLHASNLAIAAGAEKHELKIIQERLWKEKHVTLSRAKELLTQLRSQAAPSIRTHELHPSTTH